MANRTDIEPNQRWEPRDAGGKRQPLAIRMPHDKDKTAEVRYDDNTRGQLAYSTLKRYWQLAGTAEPPAQRDTHRRPDPTAAQLEKCPETCKNGHVMKADPSNVYLTPRGGFSCRVCVRARLRGYAQARKEKALAAA
jgi:hypothetical protein